MSSPYIVKILAERPEAELRTTQADARAAIAQLQVEVEQIDQALQIQAQQARRAASRPAQKTRHGGDTRASVLRVVGAAGNDTVSPSRIIAALQAEGSTVTGGAIRNMLRRLVDEREVEKVRDGAYRLASRNGSSRESHAGSTENGASQPPLTAGLLQEAS